MYIYTIEKAFFLSFLMHKIQINTNQFSTKKKPFSMYSFFLLCGWVHGYMIAHTYYIFLLNKYWSDDFKQHFMFITNMHLVKLMCTISVYMYVCIFSIRMV